MAGGPTNGTFFMVGLAAGSAAAAASVVGLSGTGSVWTGAFRAESLGRAPEAVLGNPSDDAAGTVTVGWRAWPLQAPNKLAAITMNPNFATYKVFMVTIGGGICPSNVPTGCRLAFS